METLYKGKAFRFETHGAIGIVTFDLEGEKVNKLGPTPFEDLEKILDLIPKSGIRAALFKSAKKNSFIVGADINLIQNLKDKQDAHRASCKGQEVFSKIEDLKIPTIAAIDGACMGGGTELAVACKYRICSDYEKTAIAVPEVKLGFLPGWGGTFRIPRIVGLPNALDMCLTGKNIRADKALKMGLVSAVIPQALFEAKSLEITESLAKTGKIPGAKLRKISIQEKVLAGNFLGRMLVFSQAKQTVLKQTRGHYPAPLRMLEVMSHVFSESRHAYMRREADAFADLWSTSESRNLVGLFFLTENAKRDTGTSLSETQVKELPSVKSLGVLGAGVMGGGVAAQSAVFGLRTTIKDINFEAIAKGLAHARSLFDKDVKKKRITKIQRDNRMNLMRGQLDYAGFAGLDLVIEAIVENLEVKKKVFAELEPQVGPNCIVASNTSSLRLTDMASVFKDSSRFVGIHFFNPVDKMPLIEVIKHEKSSPEAIARAVAYSKAIGKTPVVVKDGPGFLVNRLLMPWLNESAYLLSEGHSIERLDRLAKNFGMPMGPFELLDEIGIDVAAKVSHILEDSFGPRAAASKVSDLVAKAPEVNGRKRWGRKSGLGFYNWDAPGGRRQAADSTAISSLIGPAQGTSGVKATNSADDAYLVARMFYPMINEAALTLEEGIVENPSQIDLAMIFGTGFPPFRGGLCRWADTLGLSKVVQSLDSFSDGGKVLRLKPLEALKKLNKFY